MIENRLKIYLPHIIEIQKRKWLSTKIGLIVCTARSNDSYLKWTRKNTTAESHKNATVSFLVEVVSCWLRFSMPSFPCVTDKTNRLAVSFGASGQAWNDHFPRLLPASMFGSFTTRALLALWFLISRTCLFPLYFFSFQHMPLECRKNKNFEK